jgi:hypothetical protein
MPRTLLAAAALALAPLGAVTLSAQDATQPLGVLADLAG